MQKIDKGTRLINYLIDVLCVLFLFILVNILFWGSLVDVYVPYLIMFFYYFIFESTTGQTLGKLITKTKVVGRDGAKASILKIFMRSFLRLILIDAFSYLFGTELGFHDIATLTRLKKIK